MLELRYLEYFYSDEYSKTKDAIPMTKLQYRTQGERFFTQMNRYGEYEKIVYPGWSEWRDVPTEKE